MRLDGSAFLIAASLLTVGCAATTPPAQTPSTLPARTGVPVRPDDTRGTAMPPDVRLDDGLAQDEAVAIALWNNPDFQVQIAQLGFARADLVEAGLLRNPVLSLLLPLGPKQLEATLRWPIEVLWERPRRVAAARSAFDAAAAALEQNGLVLVSDVTATYIDVALARDRLRLAEQAATELAEIDRLTQSRLDAGDISTLEARTASIDAARARQEAIRARGEVAIRANALRGQLGLALDELSISLSEGAIPLQPCGPAPALLEEALAARPDIRAAELGVEAAGRRLGWEESRIVTFAAMLDANGEGAEGFELGPGIEVSAPFFDRNQGGRARAATELRRAGAAYVAVRQRVATEIRDAAALFDQASGVLAGWRDTVLIPLEQQVGAAERAFADGDVSYLFVLENTRRLTEARLMVREAEADVARARARLERAVGRRCDVNGREAARAF
jgi:cobalt-zinc-cadmium efflux system outer membrane protein